MSLDRIIEILLGAMTAIVGYTSFWLATRTTRIESKASVKAVDAGAFERARVIYEGALDTLREELVATRADLASARSDLQTARSDLTAVRGDLQLARSEITSLRTDISGLKEELSRMKRS